MHYKFSEDFVNIVDFQDQIIYIFFSLRFLIPHFTRLRRLIKLKLILSATTLLLNTTNPGFKNTWRKKHPSNAKYFFKWTR